MSFFEDIGMRENREQHEIVTRESWQEQSRSLYETKLGVRDICEGC